MPSNTDFPEKISKRNLTDSKILRELSSSAHSFALPFIHRGIGQLGLVCSLDAGRAFMQKNGFFIDDVLSLGGLIKKFPNTIDAPLHAGMNFFSLRLKLNIILRPLAFYFTGAHPKKH